MKKLLLILVVIVAVALSAQWYKGYQDAQEAKQVASLMRGATALVVKQLNFFKSPNGETHGEVLDASAEAVKRIVELTDGLATRGEVRNRALVDHGVNYLRVSQEAVRNVRQVVLAKVETVAAMNSMERSVDTIRDFVADPGDDAKRFHSDVARYGAAALTKRSSEAGSRLDQAAEMLGVSLSKMVALRNGKPGAIPVDVYVTNEQVTGISFSVR